MVDITVGYISAFIFDIVVGLLFCQSVAFMIWHVLKFFTEMNDARRWWISFGTAAFAFLAMIFVTGGFIFAAIFGALFSGTQITYLLQEDLLHRYPHWDRDGVLYLSLLLGTIISLSFGALFYIIIFML